MATSVIAWSGPMWPLDVVKVLRALAKRGVGAVVTPKECEAVIYAAGFIQARTPKGWEGVP